MADQYVIWEAARSARICERFPNREMQTWLSAMCEKGDSKREASRLVRA
jgi:hypothetical protein